jgi:DivIVA domain-containing protein
MASSDTGAPDARGAAEAGADHGAPAGASPAPLATAPGQEREPRRLRASGVSPGERQRMLEDLRRIEFPLALRGYDRPAVDGYVEHVNRLIAELEIPASPESAVRRALDEVSEDMRGLLQRAQQTAEEISSRAQARAQEQVERAQVEAHKLREAAQRDATEVREEARREVQRMLGAAEDRKRELVHSTVAIWHERRRLIEATRAMGDQLVAIGETEAKRFTEVPGDAAAGPTDRAEHEPGPA